MIFGHKLILTSIDHSKILYMTKHNISTDPEKVVLDAGLS